MSASSLAICLYVIVSLMTANPVVAEDHQPNRQKADIVSLFKRTADHLDTRFLLWTRNNSVVYHELKHGDIRSLLNSDYDHSKITRIFIHGFMMNGYDDDRVLQLRDAYLAMEDVNFISVDWKRMAAAPRYYSASANVKRVGEQTGIMIQYLIDHGSDLNRFHLIGFSLGAHAAGTAGSTLNGSIPRITGLDPAGPGFESNEHRKLGINDASFVDVIHTNGSPRRKGFGFPSSIGTVDFYPNSGNDQPGCRTTRFRAMDIFSNCNHVRALNYFTESIKGAMFEATKCQSYEDYTSGTICKDNFTSLMGQHVSPTATGDYYLKTSSHPPYALG